MTDLLRVSMGLTWREKYLAQIGRNVWVGSKFEKLSIADRVQVVASCGVEATCTNRCFFGIP